MSEPTGEWRFFDRETWEAEQVQLPEAEREPWDDMRERTRREREAREKLA